MGGGGMGGGTLVSPHPAPSPTFLPLGPRYPPPTNPNTLSPLCQPPSSYSHSFPVPIPHPCKTCTSSYSSSSSSIRTGTLYTHHTHRLPLDVIHGSVTVQLEVTDIEWVVPVGQQLSIHSIHNCCWKTAVTDLTLIIMHIIYRTAVSLSIYLTVSVLSNCWVYKMS